jgi:ribonuclease P/MRP protein subunit RPP40
LLEKDLLEFLETVTIYIDQGLPINIIYLDFPKAFDKVSHKRPMLKLKSGITVMVFDWIKDCLQDREQRIVLLGSSFEWIKFTNRVLQGSVLGLLSFLIYINNI